MIAPDLRPCKATELVPQIKKFVEENHSNELWESLQSSIQEMDSIKKELQQAPAYRVDVEQLKKYKDLYTKNYQNAMVLNKYFVFGSGQGQIPCKFSWQDSFTKGQHESYNPIFDALSSKFNIGVCLARIACYMNLEGDGIKYACKYMQ